MLVLLLLLLLWLVVVERELLTARGGIVGSRTVSPLPGAVTRRRQFGALSRNELKCFVKVTQRGLLFVRIVGILIITAICLLVDHYFPFRIRRRRFGRWGRLGCHG